MRRPLKPFVTEYKGPSRRQKDGASAFGTENDTPWVETAERKTAKSPEAKNTPSKTSQPRRGEPQRDTNWTNDTSRFNGGQNEDSYEAALRAADALFSGVPARQAESGDPAPTTDAVFDLSQSGSVSATTGGSGRILRVIDEELAPELMALEADRTPKRRGRKPGSKNKPKVLAPVGPNVSAIPVAPLKVDWTVAIDEADEGEIVARPIKAVTPTRPFVIPSFRSRGESRFAWVRTKLGPGEAWKRRLPKILW